MSRLDDEIVRLRCERQRLRDKLDELGIKLEKYKRLKRVYFKVYHLNYKKKRIVPFYLFSGQVFDEPRKAALDYMASIRRNKVGIEMKLVRVCVFRKKRG